MRGFPPPWDPADDFVIGKDDFTNLDIQSTESDDNFYYIYDNRRRGLIKYFVLDDRPKVSYVCSVSLIKKGDRFTPRLAFIVRDKEHKKKVLEEPVSGDSVVAKTIKSNVNVKDCYVQFWQLIDFLQSLRGVDVPGGRLSLVKKDDASIVTMLRDRDPKSLATIIKMLSQTEGVRLSEQDVNELLRRRDTLRQFRRDLADKPDDEAYWQKFFEHNKWIFGYGLNYQVLRQE